MSIKSWAKTKNWGSQGEKLAKCGIETTAVTPKSTAKHKYIACNAKFFPPYLRQVAKTSVATSHSVVRPETSEISEQRTAFVWIFAQEFDMMSERLWQTALADHCINKPLKKLRWSYWRLIRRQNSFDMYHWALGRSEKFQFDQFE